MKLFFTTVSILLVLFTSCSTDKCYKCQSETFNNNIIAPSEYGEPYDSCGVSRSEIRDFEEQSYKTDGNYITKIECEKLD